MFQHLTSMLPSSGPKFGSEVSEIERFRACQRHLYRGQAVATSLTKIEKIDIDNGRTRKISANRQRVQCCSQDDDGVWPKSAGTEMHLGYNAFDFSTSPEAFYNEPEEPVTTKEFAAPGRQPGSKELQELVLTIETEHSPLEQQKQEQHITSMAKQQITSMGFNSTSMWDQMFQRLRHSGGPVQRMPATTGQTP
ncbi:unnamed protein product [Peronospora destructor]|uniref:Uncharacterized protein n=1 Tax=Peronospora destructor TaxID=86335 RepID=A0AAV0US34_9STRA|nr:unnamed protein product [Peronospora destructor]